MYHVLIANADPTKKFNWHEDFDMKRVENGDLEQLGLDTGIFPWCNRNAGDDTA
jgi:hypothetical protein